MCSIAGLLDKNGNNVASTLVKMLEQTSHRGPDGCRICIGGFLEKANDPCHLLTEKIKGRYGLGHSRLKITGIDGVQPLTDCFDRLILGFNGEIWNYKELREQLISSGHVFETDSDSEVVVHLVEENCKKTGDLCESVLITNKMLDGEFAFAIFDNISKKILLTRDPVGIKQLYYGKNKNHIAFCSEKKPLWMIGIHPTRVLPGEIIEINVDEDFTNSISKKKISNELVKPTVKIFNEKEALDKYKQALFDSVKKRVAGQKKIGIIFSGGIERLLITRIAQMLSCDITCYTAGFPGSSDISAAVQASKELGFELKVREISEYDIMVNLEKIISSIESYDHLQVDVAIPMFFAVKEAQKDAIRVMLTGQGADELFAGYPWYLDIFKNQGVSKLNQSLWNDIKNIYKDTLEREDKITMYHSVELRVPYLDPHVIHVSMSISEDLKIKNNHVKYIHRRLAEDLGISHDLAWRKKEAAQHGSNVHSHLLRVVENIKNNTKLVAASKNLTMELLGSAYRYNHDVYKENESIQHVLDSMGEKLGLYPHEMHD